MSDLTPVPLLDGLVFPEGPRWHAGRLWFSDMHGLRVMAVDLDGRAEVICEVPEQPSGLGFTPDGRLLVASMRDHRLLRLDPGGLVTVADVSPLVGGNINDMVVDRLGRAYIGNFGFAYPDEALKPANLVLVTPDGQARVVAEDLLFPNGAVITPDERTLIVAETSGRRLTAFDIAADGSLGNRRAWADVAPAVPDGICLDAEGAIWVASPSTQEFLRVREGGEVTDRIPVAPVGAYACMLGGPDRRTLFLLTSDSVEATRRTGHGWISTVRVAVPGAGRP